MASRPMQLGVSTWVWTSPATTEVLETLLPHIAALGFDVIELPIEEVGQFDVPRVGELARAHGLEVSVCAVIGPGRDLLLPDEAERGVAYLRSCIEVARTLGSPTVAGPFYSAVGRCWRSTPAERERDVDQVARTLRSLGA
ncbi:MAG TPA: TIM barrel protein, partial [Gemmatimonadaceae bacterium]|nr:TIM barrel protein [Gemmatimonadaceae bacterium]